MPGTEVQYQMAPAHRERKTVDQLENGQYRLSAVMAVLCREVDGRWFIPLTERFAYAGAHGGQVSLPGGKYEPEDRSTDQTALRECYEEIGLENEIEVLGRLSPLYIPVSGFLVEPWVAVCHQPAPQFLPHPREVKSIIRLGLHELLDHSTVRSGDLELGREGDTVMKIKTPWFVSGDFKIWGATAMILNELKAVAGPIF